MCCIRANLVGNIFNRLDTMRGRIDGAICYLFLVLVVQLNRLLQC